MGFCGLMDRFSNDSEALGIVGVISNYNKDPCFTLIFYCVRFPALGGLTGICRAVGCLGKSRRF